MLYDVVPFFLSLNDVPPLNNNLSQINLEIEVCDYEDAIIEVNKFLQDKDSYLSITNNIILSTTEYFKDSGSNAVNNIINAVKI